MFATRKIATFLIDLKNRTKIINLSQDSYTFESDNYLLM